MASQPLWVILCQLPKKGRKRIEELADVRKIEADEEKSEETEEI